MRNVGAVWETVVEKHLLASGLRLIARNFTCRYGEIDLVMPLEPDAQFDGHGGPRGDQLGDDALMLLDRPHIVRPKTVGYQSSTNSARPCLRSGNS